MVVHEANASATGRAMVCPQRLVIIASLTVRHMLAKPNAHTVYRQGLIQLDVVWRLFHVPY